MAKRKKKTEQPQTTAQQLSSLVDSARKIMRKDKGLNGDLDRLPMLTWIMFLKFLDDMELIHEEEAKLAGTKYQPTIKAPYRWRDWAAKEDGITGDELIAFINQEEAIGPTGKKDKGLFAYLRSLQGNGKSRRDVIANVFRGIVNRMINGYLLRDVINKVNGIHFNSSEEMHTLGMLYESMLREMRDAAGDSGEFYTPRPVVKFMVEVMNPQLGETVLDPACGTGGFLSESYMHLEKQCKAVTQRKKLQEKTIYGQEAKPLPYMLGQMNLLLHGLEYPQVIYGNTLAQKMTEIGDKDRVNIILTNPPFGGEEEAGIKNNFPNDMQTSETALLFLQYIMRKLKRPSKNNGKPGRAAVVLPDGILSQEGVAARVRQVLVNKYNLHTVVRLPKGVFEPYTKSSTSVLFFETGKSSEGTWYYEISMRKDIKAYTQNRPFVFDECNGAIEWWHNRIENENAWFVSKKDIQASNYSLNHRNPNLFGSLRFRDPLEKLDHNTNSIRGILRALSRHCKVSKSLCDSLQDWPYAPLGDLVTRVKRDVQLSPESQYPVLAMSWYSKGLYVKHVKNGSQIKAAKMYRVEHGDFVYNRLFAWKGSFAEATNDVDGCFVSNEFPTFAINSSDIAKGYLWAYFAQPAIWDYIESLSTGTTSTSRLRLKENRLLQFPIPVPPLKLQKEIASLWAESLAIEKEIKNILGMHEKVMPSLFERVVPFKAIDEVLKGEL